MALVDLWKDNKVEFEAKSLENILGFVRPLGDGSNQNSEFRAFLKLIPTSMLKSFALECLSKSFADAGFALQDIVNEAGSRMGYAVEFGRYRGTSNAPAPDGIWRAGSSETVIVEVKTTSTYTINLDRIASYSEGLSSIKGQTSTLIVVGRFDTEGWEAQIRGSRHAWDTRMISVDALIKLLEIRESIEDPIVFKKARAILRPREYTLVDEIVDLVFLTAEEVKETDPETDSVSEEPGSVISSDTVGPANFYQPCVERLSLHFNKEFQKEARTRYLSTDNKTVVQLSLSKLHNLGGPDEAYWFAYHPYQRERLLELGDSYLALGCGSSDLLYLFPATVLEPWLEKFWVTERPDGRKYWHLKLHKASESFLTAMGYEPIKVGKYRL